MINVKDFLAYLKFRGYLFFSGVPCSILKELLNEVFCDKKIVYIPAVRENSALGVASGAYLAGKKSGILMQNSGIGNIVNALTSFNLIYKIPVLIFVTWRGYKGKDAPEHMIMGKKTTILLDGLDIPYRVLSDSYKKDISWAIRTMKKKLVPVILIIKDGYIK